MHERDDIMSAEAIILSKFMKLINGGKMSFTPIGGELVEFELNEKFAVGRPARFPFKLVSRSPLTCTQTTS